tara:strand:- start:480 stop:812 length:333 start_codon:yes stop_codon:yes gene_type:complete
LKQFFDAPKLQSPDKNLLKFSFFYLKETCISVPVSQQNSVFVSICYHQSLKKKQRCQFWFCVDAQNKTKLRDCFEEFHKDEPNVSTKFFFWLFAKKKQKIDLKKELKICQ